MGNGSRCLEGSTSDTPISFLDCDIQFLKTGFFLFTGFAVLSLMLAQRIGDRKQEVGGAE